MKGDQTTLTPGMAPGGTLQHPCILLGWWHPTAPAHPGLSMQPRRAQQGPLALWLPLYFGFMFTEPAGLSLTAVTPDRAI